MAAPNIINAVTITGLTTSIGLGTTSLTNLLSNSSSSNKVFKINTVFLTNISSSQVSVDVNLHNDDAGIGTYCSFARSFTIPSRSSLVVISKDSPFYMEENRCLSVVASVTNSVHAHCSYESVS